MSVDVIVGLPPSWRERKDLNKDLELLTATADHVSVYELTVEPGTRLSKSVAQGEVAMPCSERSADEVTDALSLSLPLFKLIT